MTWKVYNLNKIATKITKGTTPTSLGHNFKSKGINYIKAESFNDSGEFLQNKFAFIDKECHSVLRRSVLQEKDVLFTIAGVLGRCAIVKKEILPANTNQAVAIIRLSDENKVMPEFVRYWLSQDIIRSQVNLEKIQSAQPNINLKQLGNIEIAIPNFNTQKQIVNILSAYDDLIENNLKRIKLLEQAAQNIYKEWFVNMRFPGYEEAKFDSETGLPEGWNKVPFSSIAKFINGYAFKPRDQKSRGLPIVKIKELKNGITKDTPRNSGGEIDRKYHFSDNTILFSWSASLDVYWWNEGCALLNQHLFKVEPEDSLDKVHFYYSLKDAVEEFRSRANGSTMKHIKRKELDNVYYVQPEIEIAQAFGAKTTPIRQQVLNLSKQNKHLLQARDILLPRLMNQTIEV